MVPERGVQALLVVEYLDVVEKVLMCLGSCSEVLKVDRFCFESVEGRFAHGIVVTAQAVALDEWHWLLGQE